MKPLSLSYLWMDFQSRIYGFDSVFPRTIKELTTRPGAVIERFIKGNRIVYVGPVGYFFLMVAISVLLMDLTGLDFFEFSKTVTPISGEITSKQEQVSKLMSGYVAENFRLFKFLLIPVNTFWIWLFIRKKGYNYIKSSVAAFYAQGQLELFYMINIVTLYFFDWHFYQFVFLLEPAYYGFIFITWMSGNKIKSFLKGALV
ncbi:MAG: DUF3667 domain-containing protein, partial [Cyclobacteriaceae bacterium]